MFLFEPFQSATISSRRPINSFRRCTDWFPRRPLTAFSDGYLEEEEKEEEKEEEEEEEEEEEGEEEEV